MTIEMQEIDRGWNAIERELKLAHGGHALIGIQSDEGAEPHGEGTDLITLAEVAWVQEFGNERIPSRSFLRGCLDARRREIGAFADRLVGRIMRGELTARQALDRLGEYVVTEIRKYMADSSNFEANADATIAKKSKRRGGEVLVSDKPLFDTAIMARSIRSVTKL